MTDQNPTASPRSIRRGLTAAHFWNAALALGFAGAAALAAESRLGAEYAHLLVPVVVAAGLVGLAISTLMYRSDVASLPCPLVRVERTLDAMTFGRLPEQPFEVEPGILENLTESVSGLLYRLHGLDGEVHAGTSRLRVLVADLPAAAHQEAVAILEGIRELVPTASTMDRQPVESWLMAEESAPIPTPSAPAASALDLLCLDDPDAEYCPGPGWELRTTSADELTAA